MVLGVLSVIHFGGDIGKIMSTPLGHRSFPGAKTGLKALSASTALEIAVAPSLGR